MILVAVSDEDTTNLVSVFHKVGYVGNNQVDTQHLIIGEAEAGIDYDNVIAIFNGRHILADLLQTAEGDNAKLRIPISFCLCIFHIF